MGLNKKEMASYGIGAVGKDMVYMFCASYILYYYQDILGVSAIAMGIILLAARVFDAFNDPIMGVVVAKTRTRWGKFRPWLFIGTLLNAVVLFLMFSAPPTLDGGGLVAYAAVTYVLWGVTYTMMDIPYWSMIPAFTEGGKERENMSTMARSCAGVGSALVTIITMQCVYMLGKGNEYAGFKWFALIISILFFTAILITCFNIREKSTVDVETVSVKQMFKALFQNDQAVTVVITIVLINTSDVLEGKVLNHIYIPNENLKGQFKKTFEEGDILYSEIRPQNKRYAYIDFAPINYIASTKLMVIRNKNIVKSKYLYYFLQSDKIISELQMLAETRSGTFPQITFNELSKLSIKIPPLPEQDRIISILDSICKKIDINQQINDNLAPVHESKDTNKPEKSITFSSQPIRPSFSNKNISGRDILYPALRSTTIPYPDPYKRFFLAP